MQSQQQRSKYLSYLLRHKPETAGLTLDREGWCSIEQLLANTDFTVAELEAITAADDKQRYTIRYWEMGGDGLPHTKEPTHIRANQGHSTDKVKLSFKRAVPPVVLYHGTSSQALSSIMEFGLLPMNRHHVHLSADLDTARSVGGRRRGDTVIFEVDAKTMLANGYSFYLSDNQVWLVDAVPPPFLKIHHD